MHRINLPHNHGEELIELTESIPEVSDFQTISDLLKQISDCTRLRIFWVLCHCKECVINISAIMGMTSPAVSHHLKLLKASGLIVSERVGKEVYYTASDSSTAQLLHHTIENILHLTCPDEH